MRILHASDCYLPQLGGIEVQVHDLAAAQIAAGHRAMVLTATPSGVSSSPVEADHGVPVVRLPGGLTTLPSVETRRQVSAFVREGGFDVVHVHSSVVSSFAWTVARTACAQAVPTVVTMHSMMPSGRLLSLSDALAGWSRAPVTWTAVSDVAAEPLRRLLGHSAVGVLPNGIDPGTWRVSAPRRDSPDGALSIVSVMRLSRRKRPMALMRMLAGIRAAVPTAVPIRAVLIGDGPQQARLERFLQVSGMQSWVTLTGRLTREQIRPLLGAADVYLAPAELESFGIAALEARCTGLPVIAMAAGGVGEFIRNGREGFLVGSDAEMVQMTAQLLTSPRLRAMQEHNRCSVPDLAWPRVVGLSQEFYWLAGARAGAGAGAGAGNDVSERDRGRAAAQRSGLPAGGSR